MADQNVVAELKMRQTHRGPIAVDRSVAVVVGEVEREIRASQKRVTKAEAAVGDVLPVGLSDLCEGMSVRSGVLTLRAVDSTGKFRLSQWLRAGGEGEIKRRAKVAVRMVKVR